MVSRILGKNAKRRSEFIQPGLPYAFDALEPYIDRESMELHYAKHHATYTQKFNEAAKGTGIFEKSIREIMGNISNYPLAIRNNGGGYLNHSLFWNMMSPVGGGSPSGILRDAIERDFGSQEAFMNEFNTAAQNLFGSGWTWLIIKDNKLVVTTTQNQDNPLMDVVADKGFPLLCLDVWEHAYYMKNQNRRKDYISGFWNVVNWDYVSQRYTNWQKRNTGIA
ncbi:MAG: superoxide dismutase [Bacteroidales bacterium]|nr:superoxide dismutase [Bacteroidales bacterium]